MQPDIQRPHDALSCQHQNASWSTRLRRTFTVLAGTLLGAWVGAGIVLAWQNMSIASYVAQILLPSAPGILAVLELIVDHRRGASAAAAIAEEATALAKDTDVTAQDLRRLQDGIFRYRVDFHQPPTWYYKSRRRRYQAAGHDVAMITYSPNIGDSSE